MAFVTRTHVYAFGNLASFCKTWSAASFALLKTLSDG